MVYLFKWRQMAGVVLLALLFWVPSTLTFADPEFMAVEDIQPGMRGVGKTVVAGDKIEEFGVEVLGVMKDKGASGDLILVRTYGDVIERTGGIAQGMSGSPVYIDGKLIGAVAYGWALTDHKVGMVTPIGDMLKLWSMTNVKHNATKKIENKEIEKDNLKDSAKENTPGSEMEVEVAPDVMNPPEPLSTPLMASGFSQQALAMLTEKLKPFHLVPYGVGESAQSESSAKLEPGSAVGVELVRGDVSLGALGTVTYVEGNKVLAFGHPFLKKGNVGYYLTNAYVFTTINGLENSFKVGTTGELLGIINQDRGAGIAGEMDKYPSVVPLRITVKDNNLGLTKESFVQVIQDQELAPILSATAVFNVIEKTTDRVGPGTARVKFEITAKDMPGGVFQRENMFYSPANIGELAIAELHEALALLSGNQYNPVDIMDVKVSVSVDSERLTASVLDARAATATAKPGEKVNIAVKLQPFRGTAVTRTVPFTIPKNQTPGPLTLQVRGGSMMSLTQLLLKSQGLDEEMLKPWKKKQQTFDGILKELADRDRNNDIIVEVMDKEKGELAGGISEDKAGKEKPKNELLPQAENSSPAKTPAQKAGSTPRKITEKQDKKSKNFITTDYIIVGDAQVLVNVI